MRQRSAKPSLFLSVRSEVSFFVVRCRSRYAIASNAVFRCFLVHFCLFFLEAPGLSAVDIMFFVLVQHRSYAVLFSRAKRGPFA